jgi:hypothetical protein
VTFRDLSREFLPLGNGAFRYGQGVIEQFNKDTFDNVVRWRNTRLQNLPFLSAASTDPDITPFLAGDVVLLLGWNYSARNGIGSWLILGRIMGGNGAIADTE